MLGIWATIGTTRNPPQVEEVGQMSRRFTILGTAIALVLLVVFLTAADQTGRDELAAAEGPDKTNGQVEVVTLFDSSAGEFPEGIAVDKAGNIYVGLGAPLAPDGEIRKITPNGEETTLIGGQSPAGLAVDAPGNVYYANFTLDEATRGVYRLTSDGVTERLPGTGAIILPNGLAFDKQGNLYVSDSVLGAIWRIPRGGSAELWIQHESLEGCGFTPGFPPVGANGVAYRQKNLYVASTEQGLLVRIPIRSRGGAAGTPEIIAGVADCDPESDGLDSMDGIALDVHGNVFALLVMQHKLVVIDPATGEFSELLNDTNGLYNAASIAFGTGKGDRQSVFLSNFALIPPEPDDSLGPAVLKYDVGVPGWPIP
jgi:sugar lactone lactonase YvrE